MTATAERRTIDPSVTLTQNEAVLAVLVEHLEHELNAMRYALSGVMHHVYGRERCHSGDLNDWPAFAFAGLYPEQVDPGNAATKNYQAKAAPFPAHWLGKMARTGRSLAQVAGRARATAQVEQTLGGAAS